MSIRIVHVITGLSLGGAEMALYRLLSRMDRSRFDPVVVSLSGDGPVGAQISDLAIPVHSIGLRPGISAPAAMWRFASVLGRLGAAVIQGWQYHGSLAAQLAQLALGLRAPVLWNIRHCVYDLAAEKRLTAAAVRLGARLSHRAERVIYVAETSALQHEALGYRADKRVILPNGFDTGRFAPCDDARLQLRHDLGLAPSAVLIGSIARYHPMKDHANFLRAAHECVRAHPDTHFVLAGDRVDPSNVTLTRLVDSLGLASRAHLLGRRDDAPHVLAGLDIATSASYSEAFPNVIGEAMACGVPCVVTDVGDSALVVGETGRTVPPRQPRALARAWADLIELGRNGRVAMGQTARRRIVEHYGLRSVVSRYERLYEDLAGRRPGPVGQATAVGSGAARDCLE